jgi:hypothetical protein
VWAQGRGDVLQVPQDAFIHILADLFVKVCGSSSSSSSSSSTAGALNEKMRALFFFFLILDLAIGSLEMERG